MFRFLRLNDQCYRDMTKRVMDLAYKVCGGRIVSLLEGGYTISTLVRCSVVHARALATYGQPGAVQGINCRRRANHRRDDRHLSEKKSRRGSARGGRRRRWMITNQQHVGPVPAGVDLVVA